jgi:LPXTG-motif cell wall-anchored protein
MTSDRNQPLDRTAKTIKLIKVCTYATSAMLFALWGMIFINQTSALLKSYALADIPTLIWIVQGLHLALLVGYLLIFKRLLLGAILIAGSGIPFFAFTGGENTLLYTLVSMIPVFLVIFMLLYTKKKK